MNGPDGSGFEVPERLRVLRDRLLADERVLGAALLAPTGQRDSGIAPDCGPGARIPLVIASTFDARDELADELADLGRWVVDLEGARTLREGSRWTALARDLTRLEIDVLPLSELKPSARGVGALPIVDHRGLMSQWARWSEGRPVAAVDEDAEAMRQVLRLDEFRRDASTFVPGRVQVTQGPAGIETRPLRHRIFNLLRDRARRLDVDDPVQAALDTAIGADLASVPHAGEGLVVIPAEGEDANAALDRFLRVADGEGFGGDRPLFARASAGLADLAGRPVAFEHGFVVPTFDAVEARFGLDQPTGGCGVPLAPGVLVGVGVTPTDALEVWAAPSVRAAGAAVACVQDDGEREVIVRTAGKDALFEALDQAVAGAYARVPELLAAARAAAEDSVEDASAALRPLHLPRSHVAAALLAAGPAGAPDRLRLALALTRAAEDAAPLVARKLSLAAGRLL